jgi:hypothetical protein
MKKVEPKLIDGKTIEEWDQLWVRVEGGLRQNQPQLRWQVGVFRVSFRGEVVAIGVGTDKRGGLAKRFSDFRRPSPSGRNHHAGLLIYENRDLVEMEVLITGHGPLAQEFAKQLKTPMIRRHRPAWTAPNAPFMRKG